MAQHAVLADRSTLSWFGGGPAAWRSSSVATPGGSLARVSCPTATLCVAVGTDTGYGAGQRVIATTVDRLVLAADGGLPQHRQPGCPVGVSDLCLGVMPCRGRRLHDHRTDVPQRQNENRQFLWASIDPTGLAKAWSLVGASGYTSCQPIVSLCFANGFVRNSSMIGDGSEFMVSAHPTSGGWRPRKYR
jgi:hypothetical protein